MSFYKKNVRFRTLDFLQDSKFLTRLRAAENLSRTDAVRLEIVQALDVFDSRPVLVGNLAKAIPTTDLVELVLANFLLERCLDVFKLIRIERDRNVPESSFFKVKNSFRVDIDAIVAHFEVQVCAERSAGVSANANDVAGLQFVADIDLPAFEMGVKRCKTVPVVEDDIAAVAPAATLVAYLDDLTCKSGDDGPSFAMAESEIDTAVHATVLTRSIMACNAAAFRRDDSRCHIKDEQLGRCSRRGGIRSRFDIGFGFGIFAGGFFGIEVFAFVGL